MKEEARTRLDAALDVIRTVYQTVDAGISAQTSGLLQQTYEGLTGMGRTGRQAKKEIARRMCAGICCTPQGYVFCEKTGLEQVARLQAVRMN